MVERTAVRAAADEGAVAVSELLYGEAFHPLAAARGWLHGWCGHDRYLGHVRAADLGAPGDPPTHRVIARTGPIFDAPSIKAAVRVRPPMGALLAVEAADEDFVQTEAGWLHARHVAPLGEVAADAVEVAGRLLGAPYLWGGRSGEGIDCSGLVQVALALCGVAAPRDSDQQREALGSAIDPAGGLKRGDLVFFPGHVGLMVDATHLLHANAFWMTTLVEPLADVVARLAAAAVAEPVVGARRL